VSHDTAPAAIDRLAALAAFLPIFESADFSFGAWHMPEGHFPYFEQSPAAVELVQVACHWNWVRFDFDWVSWKQTGEAERFVTDPNAVATASIDDLEHLLTAHIRQERFSEGHLAAIHDSGHLLAILQRAGTLLQEQRAT
jgi:hypothetical protein